MASYSSGFLWDGITSSPEGKRWRWSDTPGCNILERHPILFSLDNFHNSTPIFSRVVLYCFTLKCWDGLQKVWSLNEMQSSSTEQAKNITESERYIFRVFCYRAEAVSSFHLNCPSGKVYENRLLKEAFNFLFFAFSGFLKIQETLPLMIVRSVIFLTVCMFIHRAFRWKITTQLAFMLGKP